MPSLNRPNNQIARIVMAIGWSAVFVSYAVPVDAKALHGNPLRAPRFELPGVMAIRRRVPISI
jgi:hypothetical protein